MTITTTEAERQALLKVGNATINVAIGLEHFGGHATIKDLADYTHHHPAVVGGALRTLAGHGLVKAMGYRTVKDGRPGRIYHWVAPQSQVEPTPAP